jgi:rhodanese-related sulfurtransferase
MLLDTRSRDEFENKHKDSWRNIGHIQKAVNIPGSELESRLGELDKKKEIVVYGFSSGTEVYRAAALLKEKGFQNVRLLVGGIFNLRWSSGNVKGQETLRDLVVNVPEINQ